MADTPQLPFSPPHPQHAPDTSYPFAPPSYDYHAPFAYGAPPFGMSSFTSGQHGPPPHAGPMTGMPPFAPQGRPLFQHHFSSHTAHSTAYSFSSVPYAAMGSEAYAIDGFNSRGNNRTDPNDSRNPNGAHRFDPATLVNHPAAAFTPPFYQPDYPLGVAANAGGRRQTSFGQPAANPQPAPRFDLPLMAHRAAGRGPSAGQTEQPRHFAAPGRRPYHQRPPSGSSGPDRRLSYGSTHTRRSDRSVSPRGAQRRTFDRYSTDLRSETSASSEADDASSRRSVRPRREPLPREFRRQFDANTVTQTQMNELRQQLRHFLPEQLPEGSSTVCDICQKDYSTKFVEATEEDEVAIQLPCKHVFGEHCINTWFETCKTHKNKITCPMCRKVLIDPLSRDAQFLLSTGLGSRLSSGLSENLLDMLTSIGPDERSRLSPRDVARLLAADLGDSHA